MQTIMRARHAPPPWASISDLASSGSRLRVRLPEPAQHFGIEVCVAPDSDAVRDHGVPGAGRLQSASGRGDANLSGGSRGPLAGSCCSLEDLNDVVGAADLSRVVVDADIRHGVFGDGSKARGGHTDLREPLWEA
jgi:hypothetical protein